MEEPTYDEVSYEVRQIAKFQIAENANADAKAKKFQITENESYLNVTAEKVAEDTVKESLTRGNYLKICALILLAMFLLATILAAIITLVLVFELRSDVSSLKSSLLSVSSSVSSMEELLSSLEQTLQSSSPQLKQDFDNYHGFINTSLEIISSTVEETFRELNATVDITVRFYHQLGLNFSALEQLISLRLHTYQQFISNSLAMIHMSAEDVTQQLNTSIQMTQASQLYLQNIPDLEQSLLVMNQNFASHQQFVNRSLSALQATTGNTSQQIETLLYLHHNKSQLESLLLSLSLASSCAAILQLSPTSPSGYYWIRPSNDTVVRVYCDMTRSCGGVTGGWMRVAKLDMTDSSSQCPTGLQQRTFSSKRTCFGISNLACSPVIIPCVSSYSSVCGKIVGFQYGTTNAFHTSLVDINDAHVDGVSLTHGSPRQHIWTFASALDEVGSDPFSNCPCSSKYNHSAVIPGFIGNDYFCDTGAVNISAAASPSFYNDDPLWDGAGCGINSTCCSFNSPPWFYKQLPQSTTDYIEMRVCKNHIGENIGIENIEIYIH